MTRKSIRESTSAEKKVNTNEREKEEVETEEGEKDQGVKGTRKSRKWTTGLVWV